MSDLFFLTIRHRGIFPLVIMFIGAENMFSLVRVMPAVEFLFVSYNLLG